MPHLKPLERTRFSDRAAVPQALDVGKGMAVMLLCLQGDQELRAPEGDEAETLFVILDGNGEVEEGEATHTVSAGEAVRIPSGTSKALRAGGGRLTVLGVRRLKDRA